MNALTTRVQLHEAIGTLERVREDGSTAEVLWDTGARSPVPFAWLSDPAVREAERHAALAAEREAQRQERERQRRELPEQECEGCRRRFYPARKGQRFHSEECRKSARRLGLTVSANHA